MVRPILLSFDWNHFSISFSRIEELKLLGTCWDYFYYKLSLKNSQKNIYWWQPCGKCEMICFGRKLDVGDLWKLWSRTQTFIYLLGFWWIGRTRDHNFSRHQLQQFVKLCTLNMPVKPWRMKDKCLIIVPAPEIFVFFPSIIIVFFLACILAYIHLQFGWWCCVFMVR